MFSEQRRRTWGPVLAAAVLLAVLLVLPTGYEGALAYQNADRVRAEVLTTDESSIVDTGLIRTGEQRCTVRLLGGLFEGREVTAVNRLTGSLAQDKLFVPGDVAFVVVSHSGEEISTVTMTDHYRLDMEALLAGLFLALLVLFAGATGVRAILSFAVTVLMMWKVLVPCLLRGWNPVLVAMGLWCVLDWLRAGGRGASVPAAGGSLWDCLALAAALAVNNAGMGAAAGVSGIRPLWAAGASLACTLAALPLGRALGEGLAGKLLGRFALPLSGLLLAGLGVWELLA